MNTRRTYLDRSVGETRAVVTLNDQAERLLLRRDEDDPNLLLGARLIARVASVEPAIATAFLDLGEGREAVLAFKPEFRPVRGAALEIEIRSEPRDGKLAVARYLGEGRGDPRLLAPPPDLAEALRQFAPDSEVVQGREARAAADEAEAEALEIVHPLAGGGTVAIEPTRALTAIDVDVGERKGADAKRITRQANLAAIGEAARLLRLKGLGGLVVLDLAGRGHDGAALLAAARLAFGPDNPGVSIGPVGRFGTMELSIPRRTRPLLDLLQRPGGGLSDRALAQRLVRRIEDEAAAQPGAQLLARAAPAVVQAADRLTRRLAERIGSRVRVEADPAFARERIEVSA